MKFIFIVGCIFISVSAFAEENPSLIKVSSFFEKSVDANIMNIHLNVWSKASTAALAQEAANKLNKKVKDLTDKFKLKKDEVETQYFSVTPDYAYEAKTGVSRIQGFSATHSLLITFKNIDQAGQFIDQVVQGDKSDKAGVSVTQISWDSDKKGQAESDCIAQAVKSARVRADDLARAAGVKIKGVHLLSNQQIYSNFEALDSAAMAPRAMMKSLSGSADNAVQLSPGKIKVRADVSVEYLIQN